MLAKVASMMARASDEDLFEKFRDEACETALEVLVERNWTKAYRIALGVLRDPGRAEDAAQQAFIEVVRAADKGTTLDPFGGWLRTVVVSQARKARRSSHRSAERERATSIPETATRSQPLDPTSTIREYAESLPEKLRLPLVLHFGEGLTYSEIGDALGAPAATVQSWIRSGVARVREGLVASGASLSVVTLDTALPKAFGAEVTAPAAPRVRTLVETARRPVGSPTWASRVVAGVGVAALALGVVTVASWYAPSSNTKPLGASPVRDADERASRVAPSETVATLPSEVNPCFAPTAKPREAPAAVASPALVLAKAPARETAADGKAPVMGNVACRIHFKSGDPAGGVVLWILREEPVSWNNKLLDARTDSDGRAVFELESGRFVLQASKSNDAEPLASFEVARDPVTLDLEIPDRAHVRGFVRDDAGRPIAGALVFAREESFAGHGSSDARTQGDGSFELAPLSRGKLYLHVEHEGFALLRTECENDGSDLAIVLKTGRSLKIKGTARDPSATHVSAILRSAEMTYHSQSFVVDGAFEVPMSCAGAERAVVQVWVDGFVPRQITLNAFEPLLDVGDIALDHGSTIRGRVDKLARFEDSRVLLTGTSFAELESRLQEDGSFELAGVPAEPVKLEVSINVQGVGATKWTNLGWLELDAEQVRRGDLGVIQLTAGK